MYVWLWRKLPGGLLGKLAGCLVLLAGALSLLFFVVFPYVEPRLPFNRVNINLDEPAPSHSPGSTSPGSTPSAAPSPSVSPTL